MLDVQAVRREFPALNESFDGRPAVFFDNPGGTQVHQSVIDAMTDYMIRRNANTHGVFTTSVRSDAVIDEARQAAADLLGAQRDEVVFGNNMTSLAFALSRALAHEVGPGDEVAMPGYFWVACPSSAAGSPTSSGGGSTGGVGTGSSPHAARISASAQTHRIPTPTRGR